MGIEKSQYEKVYKGKRNIMNIKAESIDEFFEKSNEQKDSLKEIDAFIQKHFPAGDRKLYTSDSICTIGYGEIPYENTSYSGSIPIVAIAPQKNNVSLYIMAWRDGKSLPEIYSGRLGKATNGKGCIRFKNFKDLNSDVLVELLSGTFEIYQTIINSVEYRQACKADSNKLKKIARGVIAENYVHFLGIEATSDFIESGKSDKEIVDNLEFCTVLTLSGQIIGFSITKENLLHLLMIDVPFQNKGFGTRLLSFTEEKLFKDYKLLQLQTFEVNTIAVQFYLKQGWVIANRESIPELKKTMLLLEKRYEDKS